MSGNMQELVNDIYDSEAYDNHASDNVVGPSVGELAVPRGGTWWDMTREVRVTSRHWYFIDSHPGVQLARSAQD
jgi:formylglycine-generating enzyme required for sulfatase activity